MSLRRAGEVDAATAVHIVTEVCLISSVRVETNPRVGACRIGERERARLSDVTVPNVLQLNKSLLASMT